MCRDSNFFQIAWNTARGLVRPAAARVPTSTRVTKGMTGIFAPWSVGDVNLPAVTYTGLLVTPIGSGLWEMKSDQVMTSWYLPGLAGSKPVNVPLAVSW